MTYIGAFDRGNPASSNYYRDPAQKMREQINAGYQNYFSGLRDRASNIKTLESMNATSPEEQLKKYIWQSNEQMMPFYGQQQMQPQQQYQPIQPQVQPMQPEQPQMPEWQQYASYAAPMNYYHQPSYYQPQPLSYGGYGQQQMLW